MRPYIVRTIKNPDGSVYEERGPQEIRTTLQRTVDRTLIGLLEQVVAAGGGSKAAVKGYRIAGKTGTAQKIRRETSGYLEGRYIASFCGFAPVEDPIFTVLVMIPASALRACRALEQSVCSGGAGEHPRACRQRGKARGNRNRTARGQGTRARLHGTLHARGCTSCRAARSVFRERGHRRRCAAEHRCERYCRAGDARQSLF